jgi:hypothetical protein
MTNSIIDTIQANLGLGEIEKIDPNTQEARHTGHSLAQAAIPTVLLGLYKYASTEIGADEILHRDNQDWLGIFFGSNKQGAVQKVAAYTGGEDAEVESVMDRISREAVRILREKAPANASPSQAKSFIMDQRSDILKRLPAELQIGDLLNDNTLDDRTNKMEGPMSNHMHFLEKLFSGGTTEDQKKNRND